MEAIYFGSAGRHGTGGQADGPWVGADLENGLCALNSVAELQCKSIFLVFPRFADSAAPSIQDLRR